MCPVFVVSVLAAFVAIAFAIRPESVNIALDTRIHLGSEELADTDKLIEDITKFLNDFKTSLKLNERDGLTKDDRNRSGNNERREYGLRRIGSSHRRDKLYRKNNGVKHKRINVKSNGIIENDNIQRNVRKNYNTKSKTQKEKDLQHTDGNLNPTEEKREKYLTNFLRNAARVIVNFKNSKIERFFKMLYKEMKDYFQNEGSTFTDIVENHIVRLYLHDKLQEFAETEPIDMITLLYNYINDGKNEHNTYNALVDFLDNYYEEKNEELMRKYVEKLSKCRKRRDFSKVIRSGLHSLFFRHYDKFNYTTRAKITEEIAKLREYAIKRRALINDDYIKLTSRNGRNGMKILKNPKHSVLRIHAEKNKGLLNKNGAIQRKKAFTSKKIQPKNRITKNMTKYNVLLKKVNDISSLLKASRYRKENKSVGNFNNYNLFMRAGMSDSEKNKVTTGINLLKIKLSDISEKKNYSPHDTDLNSFEDFKNTVNISHVSNDIKIIEHKYNKTLNNKFVSLKGDPQITKLRSVDSIKDAKFPAFDFNRNFAEDAVKKEMKDRTLNLYDIKLQAFENRNQGLQEIENKYINRPNHYEALRYNDGIYTQEMYEKNNLKTPSVNQTELSTNNKTVDQDTSSRTVKDIDEVDKDITIDARTTKHNNMAVPKHDNHNRKPAKSYVRNSVLTMPRWVENRTKYYLSDEWVEEEFQDVDKRVEAMGIEI